METYCDGGEFLPLSVWRAEGFDIAKIEANAPEEDKRVHMEFGLDLQSQDLAHGQARLVKGSGSTRVHGSERHAHFAV